MTLQPFSFPVPETRFIQAGRHVYKFKIRGASNCSEMMGEDFVNQELEDVVRAVLANLDGLQPFSTPHFNVFPYKKRWERVSTLCFRRSGDTLSPYPHVITLYLQDNTPSLAKHTEQQSSMGVALAPPPLSSQTESECSETEWPPEGDLPQHSLSLHQPSAQPESVYEAGEAVSMTGDDKVQPGQCEVHPPDELTEGRGEVHCGIAEAVVDLTSDPDPIPDLDPVPDLVLDPVPTPGLISRIVSRLFSPFFRKS